MCARFCTSVNCPAFSCGNTKECTQGCLGRTCSGMTCDKTATSCSQFCTNCTTERMFCSSPICKQSCKADFCHMECASTVRTCQQVCEANSTCNITCHNGTTDCQLSCNNNSICNGLPEKPKTKNLCDERTGNCTKTCTGDCGKTTLSCGDGFKECNLSCEEGCKMVCAKTVEKCVQKCIGGKPCTSVCHAASCQTIGKFHTPSSAVVCHLNNFMFVFACIMIFQLKNL
ncbi:Hypothetical predicted protein [Paramuricea clavata]|nr:Hypothetical predicted protein [Paramuricea clavata]